MAQVLAFDLGGSSLRLAIVSGDGTFEAMVPLPLGFKGDGERSFEADPMQWWAAFCKGCAELAGQGRDLSRIDAIAGCGFTRTQVFLDAERKVVRPAIAFQDSRAAGVLQEMRAAAPGSFAGLGPYDPLARLIWLKRNEPENWARTSAVLEPKDFLNMMLTSLVRSDPVSQRPLVRNLEGATPEELASLQLSRSILPPQCSPFDAIGTVRSGLPAPLDRLAGKPVLCGAMDTWSGVLGSGALQCGLAYSISGTSDVFGLICDRPHKAEGLLTVEWGPDLWQLGGPSQGAATRLHWAAKTLFPSHPVEAAIASALASPAPAPIFLPYLDGERTPFWDSDLQGAFVGLSASHGPQALLKAVAEGMNYLAREVLRRAEEASATRAGHVCFSGGLSNNPALCQLKADNLGRRIFVPQVRETGLAGAARLALEHLEPGSRKATPKGTWFEPDEAARRANDQRFEAFRQASAALTPVSHLIAGQLRN